MNAPANMRHDCRRGCYLERFVPHFEWFAHCFPGRIGLMDIDGTTEVNGYYLVCEFKAHRDALTLGQKLYLEHLDDNHFGLVAIVPDWRRREITECAVVRDGKLMPWRPCSYEQFCNLLTRWAQRALSLPTAHGRRKIK